MNTFQQCSALLPIEEFANESRNDAVPEASAPRHDVKMRCWREEL
jgi:hypothetical protein